MPEIWTLEQMADKAEWEGGVIALAEWGIKVEEVPESIRDLWVDVQRGIAAAEEISLLLPEFTGEDELDC